MKIKMTVKAVPYKVTENTFQSKRDNSEIKYYRLIVEQDGEVATVTCAETVASALNSLPEGPFGKDATFGCEFDVDSKKFKITDLLSPAAIKVK